jgi:prepilin-type N-terminal cleavage/methylation domain-containing protein
MNKKAFTLIELLVVITIVGILAGFITVQMNGAISTANDAKKKTNLDSIKKALVMYNVENGERYPVETGCTIGSCTNFDSKMQSYLPSSIDGSYTYESNGTNCTLSTILSSGYSYQYDCLAGTYSTNTPINGVCGTSNNQNLSSIPSTNLCTAGNVTVVSGSGPWTWSCAGIYSGTTAMCSTGGVPTNGTCGSSNNQNLSSIPSSNLCTNGTPSIVSGSGPWTWTCTGLYTGTTANCSANLSVNGVCGFKNNKYASTTPTGTEACTAGSITDMTGSYSWSCAGQNGGTSPSCATVAATYTVQSFTTVGTTSWTVPAGVTAVDYLVVAGGGGGGGSIWGDPCGGGGGGGGVLTSTNYSVSGTVSVVVGNGGGAGGGYSKGGNGENSRFGSVESIGGGAGGVGYAQSQGGSSGGSGGGAGGNSGYAGGGGSNISGQGYIGGSSAWWTWVGAGGGGGASQEGGAGTIGGYGGKGGDGYTSSISGAPVTYGGGGSGSGEQSAGGGGSGGGGGVSASGTNELGGGGGGGHGGSGGGAGGSGIVIIRYINNY